MIKLIDRTIINTEKMDDDQNQLWKHIYYSDPENLVEVDPDEALDEIEKYSYLTVAEADAVEKLMATLK